MADNRKIAADVLQAVGGEVNISHVTHCMTRLRFTLKDDSIPKDDDVKKIDGVLGVARTGGQYQVIIGQNVPKVYAELESMGAVKGGSNSVPEQKKITLKSIGNGILNYLSGSLTPLIPLLIAACLFNTVNSIFGPSMLNLYGSDSNIYFFFDFLYDAGFYFFPIYLGYMAAKKLGATPILGAFMGGILISPDFIALASAESASFSLFGLDVTLLDYSQTVLPIILTVALLYYVEKYLRKWLPEVLSTIFAPFLSILITSPIALLFLAPLGNILGEFICNALIAFGDVGGFVAVAIVAAIWEFLVIGGMHIVIIVMMLGILAEQGSVGGILISGILATFAAYGVALGAFLRLKNKNEKATSLGFFIGSFFGGVTEPVLYGLCFKYRRTFLGLVVGGFLGGAYAGITGVVMYAFASSSFLTALGFAGGSSANFANGIIACVIAMLGAAVITFMFGFKKEDLELPGDSSDEEVSPKLENKIDVTACIDGKVIPLSEIKDEVFSTGMMGNGVGIVPDGNVIVAPCNAKVVTVMEESKHAVGLTLKNGAELLIHEGIDTVNLQGEGFKLFVKPGDKVKKGDKLIEFDKDLLKAKGIDMTTIILLTNSDEYEGATFYSDMDAKAGETVVISF